MKRVLEIFEELSAIPRGSGNVKGASDYCAAFARARGFEAVQDEYNNCLIRVPATADKKDRPIVILQGHLDMVCEKEEGCAHNFETDPIRLRTEGDWLTAEGTTLGADNGIAIAYCLALLEEECSHPALELFFTADEETGMDGAIGFDASLLKGRRMLNLDSEDEGILIVSSAGGKNVEGRLPLRWEECQGAVYTIRVEGLQGGHSGAEIHQGRANANKLLGKILAGLNCRLIEINGGAKANVITPAAEAKVSMETPIDGEALTAIFRKEYGDRDPAITVRVGTSTAPKMMTKECSEQAIRLLSTLPDGVQEWSAELEGLVETSLNCGILRTEAEELFILTSLRSMKNAKRDALAEEVATLFAACGFATQTGAEYPAWEYAEQSPLRETAVRCWETLSGKPAATIALHAGLECGLFTQKIAGLDVIAMGPDMKDIHSPRERLSIPSARRVWEWVKEILKAL